jgi:opacity protein-like surface antigen
MRRISFCILMLVVLSAGAVAQEPVPAGKVPGESESRENQVYAGFVYEPTDWGAAWSTYKGFDINYTREVHKHFALVADFDWIRNNDSQPGDLDRGMPHNSRAFGYRVGPRYNVLSKHHRFQPYVVGLFGGANFTALMPYPGRQSPLVQKDWFGFTWAFGGGVDMRMTKHFGVRGEWTYQQEPWGDQATDSSSWNRVTFGGTWRW